MPINIMEAMDTTVDTPIIAVEEDVEPNTEEIGKVAEAFRETVILHTTDGII